MAVQTITQDAYNTYAKRASASVGDKVDGIVLNAVFIATAKSYVAKVASGEVKITGSTPAATKTPAATVTASVAAKDKRQQAMDAYTGWDNILEVQQLQIVAWQIYVDTGRWDTPEQDALNVQAQKIRAYNNPMYDPSLTPNGPADWMDADKIAPRDTTPNANSLEGMIDGMLTGAGANNMLAIGGIAVIGLMAMSFFKS